MSLHKIYNFVGYNNLGLILEQERKHWLLKPDKKLNVQDSATGSIFQGRLDNLGNEVVVETNKTEAYTGSDMFRFVQDIANNIFEPLSSGLPYNNALNGLMYECIIASKAVYIEDDTPSYKNYKVKFIDCEEVIIPFGNSLDSSEIYAGKWIRTTRPPILVLPDDNTAFTIEIPLRYETSVTNCVFYYPLEENMQPLTLTNESTGVYVTEAVTDHTFIGYPIYWFTSDNTNVGPHFTFDETQIVVNDKTLMYLASPGNTSKYTAQVFCSVDGDYDATPDGSSTAAWEVVCKTVSGSFTGTTSDANVPIDIGSIKFVKISTGDEYPISINHQQYDVLNITSVDRWSRSGNTARTVMSSFDENSYTNSNGYATPLVPLFNVYLDRNVSFMHNTTDVGYAGVHMSSEPQSETSTRYPYDLNKWSGLPQWLQDNEAGVPQHVAVYAIHNTPNYNPNDPESRQTAALLLDPGKPKTSEDVELANDERGRVYVISNDDIEYHNNATYEYQKPERTVARICDIPTSIIALTDISGLAPTTVVDKSYVHTDTSYTTDEKNKLNNILASRWVRPVHLDENGIPITEHETSDNDFIFNNEDDLNAVDLISHNDFREHVNLNKTVDPQYIRAGYISEPGSNYSVNDTGVIIIGGVPLNYSIDEVNEDGGVIDLTIAGATRDWINLSNFNIPNGSHGSTAIYGTSPSYSQDPSAGGLKLSLFIDNYEDIKPKLGNVYDDLFAFIKASDGIWLYKYNGTWNKHVLVSDAESSSIITSDGGLSTTDSYMTSIIPSVRLLKAYPAATHQDPISLKVFATASCVNIVDTEHVPYKLPQTHASYDNRLQVDFNKMVCYAISESKSQYKTVDSAFTKMRELGVLMYDCYVGFRWKYPNDDNNTTFEYCIIQRAFNNYVSSDTTTLLPGNKLRYNKFVHTNEQSSVIWDCGDVGPMLWVYDPKSTIQETYTLNESTSEINITRKTRSWADIDMRNGNDKLVDTNGKLLFNIYTNNPHQNVDYVLSPTDPIYQQPEFNYGATDHPVAVIGDLATNNPPVGTWRLVFPRTNSYTFTNSQNGQQFDAIKMDVLRGDNLGNLGNVKASNGHIVNNKILVIDRQAKGNVLRAYNAQTNSWDNV